MKKIIEVTLNEDNDLYEKYNKNIASRELINYLVDMMPFFNKKDIIKIVVNNNLVGNDDSAEIIKKSLRQEYENLNYKYNQNNSIQILYLILGVAILFVSTLINDEVFKEVVLIIGWIFIWTMMELEIFNDKNIIKRRKIIRKLISSEIVENKN